MTRSKTNNPSKKSSTRKTGKSKGRPRGWRVIKILDEHQETGMFLVHWDGINPGTGRPWHDSWIPRENFFTNKLLKEWDIYKQKQKRQFCATIPRFQLASLTLTTQQANWWFLLPGILLMVCANRLPCHQPPSDEACRFLQLGLTLILRLRSVLNKVDKQVWFSAMFSHLPSYGRQ